MTMDRSPGHQKWPDHQVQEKHLDQRMRVVIWGHVIADSNDVIRVDEDQCPARYYFPRGDVRMEALERSDTTTQCPFKGIAHYYSLNFGGRRFKDAVWSYEDPYQEHYQLKDRLAFYDDKIEDIQIQPAGKKPIR